MYILKESVIVNIKHKVNIHEQVVGVVLQRYK